MLSPTGLSCNSELHQHQWQMMMMNFSTPEVDEELNNLLSLPSLQTMEPQLYNHDQSPVVASTTTQYCSNGYGDYGVIGNLQPTKKPTHQKNLSRGVLQARDHIIAERRRREKLNQRFNVLSNLVPGLNKTDKASVLGGTITYLKHLQDKVRFLEEQASQKTIESVVFANKSSTGDTEYDDSIGLLPEIEARLSGNNVLIRVHCEKRKGVLEIIMAEIEKLKLIVINSSVITFGSNSLHITIISQMGTGFNMTTKGVATSIKLNLEASMKA